MEPLEPGSFNPYAAPESHLESAGADAEGARPVPWEDFEAFPGFWKRVGGMFSLLFSNPLDLLDRIPATEEIGPAWRFCVLMAVPYLAFIILIFAFVGSVTMFTAPDPNLPKGIMAAIFGGEMLLIAAMLAAGMFIYGAIFHAMLWMWGGTREGRGLGQTLRLCGYVWGFVHLGLLVPCVNVFVGLAGLVFIAVGLVRIHRADTWRVICALLTPLLACCLLYGLVIALAMGVGAFNH